MNYVFFSLVCFTAYLGNSIPSLLLVSLLFFYMWWTSITVSRKKRAMKKYERFLAMGFADRLKVVEKKEKRNIFIWNCFGWSVLILLIFLSKKSAILFFCIGSFFFNWGLEFLLEPICKIFCRCNKLTNENSLNHKDITIHYEEYDQRWLKKEKERIALLKKYPFLSESKESLEELLARSSSNVTAGEGTRFEKEIIPILKEELGTRS